MRSHAPVVATIALVALFAVSARAGDVGSVECGTTALEPPPDSAGTLAFVPSDALVEARIVFVGFPNNDTLTAPVWADELPTELSNYILAMSRGRQQMNVSIIRRPSPDQDMAWIAPNPASFYHGPAEGGGYGAINRDVMEAIRQTLGPGVWSGVEMVFMLHAQCTLGCVITSTQTSCEETCKYGGIAGLALPAPVEGFTGVGVTQRYLYWPNVNTDRNRQGLAWVAAHEYGHWLRFNHTAGTDALSPNTVNPGKYDAMRSSASGVSELGLVPYSSLQLNGGFLGGGGWVPRQLITTDTEGLRVPDVRGPQAVTYQIPIPGSPQYFALSNHQGTTPYDAKYGANGLVIWHVLKPTSGPERAWDIESAAGKFTNGQPDPVSGRDPLESAVNALGSAADIFDGVQKTVFACGTNPNTHRYSGSDYSSPQSLPTSVAFENIRRDAATGDMLVDVFLTPKQKVLAPNGGEVLHEGQPYPIQWAVRPAACITSVDLQVTSDGGGSFTPIAQSLANSGLNTWTPGVSGPQFRIRAISRDQAAGVGTDDSNADFSVIDVTAPAIVEDLTIDIVGETEVYLYWFAPGDNGDAGTASAYELRYSTQPMDQTNFGSGTLIATSAPQLGGSLEQLVATGLTPCTPYYFALKTRDEAGHWATISNVPYTETVCFGGGGGGFSAHRVDGSEGGEGAAVNSIAPELGDERAADVAGALSPGRSTVLESANSLQPPLGILVSETSPIEGGTWRVSLRLAIEADGLDPAGAAITVEGQTASGERDTLGRFTPGETEGLLGICALRERGRVAVSGFIRLEQVMARMRQYGQDYALADARHSRLGALGADFVARGGSMELLPGDLLEVTYAPASDVRPQAPPWYLLVRRQGTAVPIPFAQGRDRGAPLPVGFALHPSEPNPAGSATIIRFDLPMANPVKLEVFDLLGRRVASVADAVYPAGSHGAEWNLRDVNGSRARPGFYMARIVAGDFRASVGLSVLP